MNQRKVNGTGFALIILGMLFLCPTVMAKDTEKDVHPKLSAQEMLIACADCHRDATPEIERQWYESSHGIAMIKCYQCHGTYGDFMVTPSRQICATCHLDMMEKCPEDKPCWECHIPHSFTMQK